MPWAETVQTVGLAIGGGLVGATAPVVTSHYEWRRKRIEAAEEAKAAEAAETRRLLRELRVTATHAVVAGNTFATERADAARADPDDDDPWPASETTVERWREAYIAVVLASEDLRADVRAEDAKTKIDSLIEQLRLVNEEAHRGSDDAPGDGFDHLSGVIRDHQRQVTAAVDADIAAR